jgi:hypothetical protein
MLVSSVGPTHAAEDGGSGHPLFLLHHRMDSRLGDERHVLEKDSAHRPDQEIAHSK